MSALDKAFLKAYAKNVAEPKDAGRSLATDQAVEPAAKRPRVERT